MFNGNQNIGMAFAGVYPDCRSLKDYACDEAIKWLKNYREPMHVQRLAEAVSV